MHRLCNTAKVIDKLLKVIFGVIILEVLITLGFIIVALAKGNEWLLSQSNLILRLGSDVSIELTEDLIAGVNIIPFVIVSACSGAILAFASLFWIRKLLHILSPMKEGRPFTNSVSKDFRTLGFLTLGIGLASDILTAITKAVLLKTLYPLNGDGYNISLNSSVRPEFILLIAFIFLLSYIFRYGEELQVLSDETL